MHEPDLVGNALCLDFANTVNARPQPSRDALATVEDLTAWAAATGLQITAGDARRATGRISGVPPNLDPELVEARELREAVYRTFTAVVEQSEPAGADMAGIVATYADALRAAHLRRQGSRFSLDLPSPHSLRELRWMVAMSASELLLYGPLERIGQCPSCQWLFLDTSRGGRRRWCSMAVCGSRAKAQRYYAARTARQP